MIATTLITLAVAAPPPAPVVHPCRTAECHERVKRKRSKLRRSCRSEACKRRTCQSRACRDRVAAKRGRPLGAFHSTSYGPPWTGIQGTGRTATGVDLRAGAPAYGIAVDPSVIALGSRVRAWPNPHRYRGCFRAFDTGGAIRGRRIDFYDWRGRSHQLAWGGRAVSVRTCGRG